MKRRNASSAGVSSSAAQPQSHSQPRRRRALGWAIGAVAFGIVAVVGGLAFRHWQEQSAIRALLPDPTTALRGAGELLREPLTQLDQRARQGPAARAALRDLAQLYDANWRAAEAIQLYRGLAQLEPAEPRWPYALARLLGGQGDLAGARTQLERTVGLSPDYLPAWLKLADVCGKLGDAPGAEAALAEAFRREPRNPNVLFARARSHSSAPDQARQDAEAAVAADPQFSPAWSWLAAHHAAAGREVDAAVARARAEAGRSPTDLDDPWEAALLDVCFDPDRLRVAAASAATARRLEHAGRWINRAASLAPKDPAVQRERGRIWRAAGDAPLARRCFELAVQLEPGFADNWANLQEAQLQAGDVPAASRTVDEGLRLHPNSPGLHLASARRYAANDRTTDALREYRESIRLRPQEAVAHIELASLLFRVDRVADGIAELNAALAAEPEHPLALSTLAFVHIGLGDQSAARLWLERARAQPRLPPGDRAKLEQRFREQFGVSP